MELNRKKKAVALLSVFSNSVLVITKLIVGLAIGSVSVISEAIHSGVDVVASVLAFYGVKKSGVPADKDHAFGHGKYENLSGLGQAFLIFLAAGWIIYEAIHKLLRPEPIETPGIGILIMFISALVNAFVARELFKVGNAADSVALKADAWHCLTDVYTSLGVMAGLVVVLICKILFPSVHLEWIDPVTAILVALLIIKAAWNLTLESLHDLLDSSLPHSEVDEIKSILKRKYPAIIGYHDFRTRKSGSVRFVEFHMLVDPDMHVEMSHRIHHDIENEITSRFPGSEVMVHIEPCDNNCPPECRGSCMKEASGKI